MGTKKHTEEDIAKQRYQGPSPVVSGLGEGAVHGKFLFFGGLVAGGLAGLLFPKQATSFLRKSHEWLDKRVASENNFAHLGGVIGKWFLNIGNHTVDWLKRFEGIRNTMEGPQAKKIAAAVDGALLTSAATSFIGLFTGSTAGVQSARRGKKQFETAKEEILDLRKKVIDKETEIDDLKAAHAAKKPAPHGDTPHHKIHAPIHEASLAPAPDQISL